jgi:hypothetical protein
VATAELLEVLAGTAAFAAGAVFGTACCTGGECAALEVGCMMGPELADAAASGSNSRGCASLGRAFHGLHLVPASLQSLAFQSELECQARSSLAAFPARLFFLSSACSDNFAVDFLPTRADAAETPVLGAAPENEAALELADVPPNSIPGGGNCCVDSHVLKNAPRLFPAKAGSAKGFGGAAGRPEELLLGLRRLSFPASFGEPWC